MISLIEQFTGLIFKILSFAMALLPRSVRTLIGRGIGFLWFDVLRIRRSVAIDNVGIAFPEWPLEKRVATARASLFSMGQTLMEYTLFPFFNLKQVARNFEFQGEENVTSALKHGKGAIFLTLHLGNGDFAVAALSRKGYPMHLISKEFKSKWLNNLWFGMRRKHGTRFISPEKSSFDILRALRRNECVVFVLDQFMGPPIGVRTTFFGRVTGTAMGCALMAERTGAPVVPCYTWRKDDGTHAVVFQAPIHFERTPDRHPDVGLRDKNIAVMTQIYTDKIESIVRLHPEQWMWIHRRWKEFRD